VSALAVAADSPTALLALARSFGRLRACEPAQAPILRAAAEYDRDVLPRWQRGPEGVHEDAEPAAYGGTLAWRNRQHWLEVVVPAAITARPDLLGGVQGTTPWSVSAETLTANQRALSLYAHAGTGRRSIVRPDRLAELLETTKRTVQRCQKAAEQLGLYVVVKPGRMLTELERYKAWKNGSRQRGLSNESALCVPAWLDKATAWAASTSTPRRAHVTPPGGPTGEPEILAVGGSLGRSAGGEKERTPSAPQLRGSGASPEAVSRPQEGPQRRARRHYDADALDLARTLTTELPWLHGTPAGRVEPALRRFTSCRLPWTAGDLADAIDAANQRLSRASMTRDVVKNPPALLAKYLRDLDPDADHPRIWLDPAAERAPRLSRIQRANAQRLAEHRLRGTVTPGVGEATVLDIRAELQRRREMRDSD
jgi:hypothetical protein